MPTEYQTINDLIPVLTMGGLIPLGMVLYARIATRRAYNQRIDELYSNAETLPSEEISDVLTELRKMRNTNCTLRKDKRICDELIERLE